MPEDSFDLSKEQAQALRQIVEALHTRLRFSYPRMVAGTTFKADNISNFMRGKSRTAPWHRGFARHVAGIARKEREALREILPNIDALIEGLPAGEPEPPPSKLLMRQAAEEFLDIEKSKAEQIPDRFRNMQYLCYRYSSQSDLIVSTDLRIYPVDPASTLTSFAHIYVSKAKVSFTTVGIVLRQADNRLVLMGNTEHGTAMFMMVLNAPLAHRAWTSTTRKPWDFHYMSGLVMGMNATGNVLASRVLCIPVGRSLPTHHLQADLEHVGVWSTADGLDKIRERLSHLPQSAQEIAIDGLSNRIGDEDVLVLRRAE